MAYYYKAGVLVPFVQKFYKQMIVVVAGLFIASMATMTLNASAAEVVVYDSIPTPLPSNLASLGHEAYSANEVGNKISFAGIDRNINKAVINMSSWACETGQWNQGTCVTTVGATFSHPITINIYNVADNGEVGTLIGTVTQTFKMPYRPSSEPTCENTTQWKDASGNCFNGKAFNIEFDLSSLPDMPNEVIYGVAYNTQNHGPSPIGQPGPYDSLNVSLNTVAPYTGSDVNPGTIFWDTVPAFGGNGTFSSNTDWGTYTVAARFIAGTPPVVLGSKDDCKKDGWKLSEAPVFKNQGQCVSSFAKNR